MSLRVKGRSVALERSNLPDLNAGGRHVVQVQNTWTPREDTSFWVSMSLRVLSAARSNLPDFHAGDRHVLQAKRRLDS